MTLSCFDYVAHFRSSTEETSASLGEHDRFQFRPHDFALEQTADLHEKDVGDEALKDLPKSSPPPRKNMAEPDLILVSSSGEPAGSKLHVSSSLLLSCIKYYLSVAPEGESKCIHLGLPSKAESSRFILVSTGLACRRGPFKNMPELSCVGTGESAFVCPAGRHVP
jgi:hypothetical protein